VQPAEVIQQLHGFVAEQFLGGDAAELTPETPLLEWGIIDSLGIAQLVAFISERLGVNIPAAELTPGNLASLRALADLVIRLAGTAP